MAPPWAVCLLWYPVWLSSPSTEEEPTTKGSPQRKGIVKSSSWYRTQVPPWNSYLLDVISPPYSFILLTEKEPLKWTWSVTLQCFYSIVVCGRSCSWRVRAFAWSAEHANTGTHVPWHSCQSQRTAPGVSPQTLTMLGTGAFSCSLLQSINILLV